MSFQRILDYWFPNDEYNEFWFDKTPDEYIKNNFLEILNELEIQSSELYKEWYKTTKGKVAIIIVLDQFTRNIYRNTSDMYKNDCYALQISKDILKNSEDKDLPLNHKIFILMPLRHSKKSSNLDLVCHKIKEYEEELGSSKLLEKFKIATYQSYTSLNDTIISNINEIKSIQIEEFLDVLDPICKNYSTLINNLSDIKNIVEKKELYSVIKNYFEEKFPAYNDRIIGISLSGGVDSMVILFLCKLLELNKVIKNIYAIHLEYINRDIAKKETELINNYCNLLNVPLYIRVIDYMNRNSVDRNFYELETKKVRFNSYKYLIEKHNIKGFCMGHHHGDLGENVLMNIFNGRDILDLFVMENDSVIDNVRLFRPLLNNPKSDIYFIAHTFEIPYLKDSTPDWSCRGVLRRQILPKLTEQWGDGIISNLAEIGEKSKEWNNVVENFVLNPIFNSIEYEKNGCKILIKQEYFQLPKVIWMRIFLKIFHKYGTNMVSRKNLDNFISSLKGNIEKNNRFNFSNGFFAIFENNNMYIFKNIFNKIKNLDINMENENFKEINFDNYKIKFSLTEDFNKIRNPITYDDILKGYYLYTERIIKGSQLHILNKFDDKDSTKKLFKKIHHFKDLIPKITSGYGIIPNTTILVEVFF